MAPTYVYILKSGITQKELSKELHLTPSTITRLLDKLVKDRLIRRKVEGKLSHIYLTEDGEAIQEDIEKFRLKLHERYKELLGEGNYNTLVRLTNTGAVLLENKDL